MTAYLLDTNHLTSLMKPGGALLARLDAACLEGDEFSICPVTVGEAWVWVLDGPRTDRRPSRYRGVRSLLFFTPLTEADAEHSARLRIDLRRRGYQLELPDALIAAVALRLNLTLLTADADFAPVTGLRTADRLGP